MNILQSKRIHYSNTILWSSCCVLFSLYAIWLSFHGISDWSIRIQERFWNEMGFISIFLGIGSVVFWLKKNKLKKLKFANNGVKIFYFRELHIALGWLSFAVCLGHSFFYIINELGRPLSKLTGYIALIVMLLVILSGAMYKHKVLNVRAIKRWHVAVACVLMGIMLVHI